MREQPFVQISNEIYGFPWALLAGGAENVVTSRWRVDGASNGKWMHTFYAAIASGSTPAEAAATAMRQMRKRMKSPLFLGFDAGERSLMTGLASDLVENAKNIGVVLTSASAASYAAGYLALRSRAHALGTDPGFTLLDQAYVFAGFRFALITLVALLAISPLLILGKAIVGATARFVKPRGLEVLSVLIAVVLAVLTLASFRPLFVEGVLLADPVAQDGAVQRALVSGVLGRGVVGVFVVLAATAAAITVLWISDRYAHTGARDPLIMVLLVIGALQLVLLPVQYGIFFADRTARVLARAPEGVGDVLPPVWLVDRGADRAALLARLPRGSLSLITIKAETLDGIAVVGTTTIAEVVEGKGAP